MKLNLITLAATLCLGLCSVAYAQIDRSVLPIPEPVFRGQIGLTPSDSKKDFPEQVAAPKGAPNVVVIMTDDVGFAASASTPSKNAHTEYQWELYNVDQDFSQANNLAAKNPEKLQALKDQFLIEATKYNVLPLDDSNIERFDVASRPLDALALRITTA